MATVVVKWLKESVLFTHAFTEKLIQLSAVSAAEVMAIWCHIKQLLYY